MIAAWQRLVAWVAETEGGLPIALFRAAVGGVLLWDLLHMYTSGAMTLMWLPVDSGGLRNPTASGLLADLLGTTTAATIWGVYAAALLGALSLLLGLFSRVGALSLVLTFPWLISLFPAGTGGHDRLISSAVFFLVFARADVALSLRCFLRHRRWRSADLIPAWPRRLLAWQLALMYTSTGLQKLGVEWWPWGGLEAVHRALLLPQWARADWSFIAWLSPLTQAGTLVTVLWEGSWWVVILWLWLRRTETRGGTLRRLAARINLRRIYVVIGILMHCTLWVMMVLGPFSPITMAYYFCLYREEELRPQRAAAAQPG